MSLKREELMEIGMKGLMYLMDGELTEEEAALLVMALLQKMDAGIDNDFLTVEISGADIICTLKAAGIKKLFSK